MCVHASILCTCTLPFARFFNLIKQHITEGSKKQKKKKRENHHSAIYIRMCRLIVSKKGFLRLTFTAMYFKVQAETIATMHEERRGERKAQLLCACLPSRKKKKCLKVVLSRRIEENKKRRRRKKTGKKNRTNNTRMITGPLTHS